MVTLKKTLTILLILFLFALGPIGFLNVLDTNVSLKYEVEQAKAMFPEDNDLSDIESHYKRHLYFFWTLTVLGPALGIVLIFFKTGFRKKKV